MGQRSALAYNKQIDGMRAIGVVTVLLYHADVQMLEGAFLDMDMFFTVSGLLITSVLLGQYDTWRRIDLPRFWLGRARRLLPALFGCVALVGVYAWLLAEPTSLGSLRLDMISALTFWSNWHFINDGTSYFAAGSHTSPLLHTWSLAVEEQFYIVWPIALALWLRYRRGSLSGLVPVLVLCAIASAVTMAALHVPHTDPSDAYYNTFARAQGFLLGSALAVWLHQRAAATAGGPRAKSSTVFMSIRFSSPRPGPGTRVVDLAGAFGLAGLFLLPFVVDFDDAWVFSGGFSVAALSCVALIWYAVQRPDGVISRGFAAGPLPAIGRRTYGLYVWHWPIYVILDPSRTGIDGTSLLVLRLATTFVVAFAFDWWVERPVRRGALRRLRPGVGPLVGVTATAGAFAVAMASTANAQPPVFGTALPGSISTVTGPLLPGQQRVVVLGDSVAFTLWKHFPDTRYPNVSVGSSTQLGCGIALPQTIVVGGHAQPEQKQCEGWEERWTALLERTNADTAIVLSGSAELFDRIVDGEVVASGSPAYHALMTKAYGHAVDVASDHGRREVLLVNIPCYNRQDEAAVGMAKEFDLTGGHAKALNAAQNDARRQERLNDVLRDVAAARPNVTLLDMRGFLCPEGEYVAEMAGQVIRPDGVHLNAVGARLWWQHFMPMVRRHGGAAPVDGAAP